MKILPSLDTRAAVEFNFLHPEEKCLIFFRRHGMCLLFTLGKNWIPFFVIYLVCLPVLSWSLKSLGTTSETAIIIFTISTVIAVILAHWFFLDVLSYLLGFILVTDKRIIEVHKGVFLREEMNEIPFERITNIHHEKNGFLQNMLNYGTLRIDSNVGTPIRMRFVPCSEDKFAKISRIYGKYITETPFAKDEATKRIKHIRRRTEGITSSLRHLFRKTLAEKQKIT